MIRFRKPNRPQDDERYDTTDDKNNCVAHVTF
jgi:hypothetical protein